MHGKLEEKLQKGNVFKAWFFFSKFSSTLLPALFYEAYFWISMFSNSDHLQKLLLLILFWTGDMYG